MRHGPIGEYGLAVNVVSRHSAEHARIIRAVAVIAHHEIFIGRDLPRRVARSIQIAGGNVRLRQFLAIQIQVAGREFR